MDKLTEEFLINIGFKKESNHLILGDVFIWDLLCKRKLIITQIGKPNEMLFICQMENEEIMSDIICMHNFDYDGYLTENKILALLKFFDLKK